MVRRLRDRRSSTAPGPALMKILFVCTGNICRSPTAEGVLLHRAARTRLGRPRSPCRQCRDQQRGARQSARSPRPPRRGSARGYTLPDRRARRIADGGFRGTFDLVIGDGSRPSGVGWSRMVPDHARDRLHLFMDFAGDGHAERRARPLVWRRRGFRACTRHDRVRGGRAAGRGWLPRSRPDMRQLRPAAAPSPFVPRQTRDEEGVESPPEDLVPSLSKYAVRAAGTGHHRSGSGSPC